MTDDPHHATLAAGLAALSEGRDMFDAAVREAIPKVTWQEAALVLRHARREVELLRAAASVIETHIITARRATRAFDAEVVPEVGLVSVRRSANRKAWDHPALASEVVESHLIASGGVEPTPWEVRDWLMGAAGVAYWRVGVLQGLGIRAADYCEETPGSYSVEIIGGPE